MKNEIEFIRNKIKENGFLNATKIKIMLIEKNINSKTIEKIIKNIVGSGFYKITYTNIYIEKNTTRELFYYNPNKKYKRKNVRKNVKK